MHKIFVNLFEQQFGCNKYNPKVLERKEIRFIKGGTACSVVDLKDLQDSGRLNRIKYVFNNTICECSIEEYLKLGNNIKDIKEEYLGIQVFNCGYRWTDEYPFDSWSGLINIDIDSKKFPKNFDINDFESRLYEKLKSAKFVNSKFYCMQRSSSGNSLHVLFYFNWKKIEGDFLVRELFEWLAAKCMTKIADLIEEIGYGEMLKYKGVLDDCSKKPAQPIYLTPSEIKFNNLDFYGDTFGDMQGFDIEQIKSTDNSFNYKVKIKFDDSKKPDFKVFPKIIKNWSHPVRFSLYKIFVRFFGEDLEEAEKWYSKIVCFIKDEYNKGGGNQYTEKELLKQFRSNYRQILQKIENERVKTDDKDYSPYTSVSSKMLNFFENCFNVKAIREGVDEILYNEYDETIELKENEYIGDYWFIVDEHIRRNENIYINADCGTGKSYFFKKLLKKCEKVIIVCHLNSIKDSVYAAELTDDEDNVVIPTTRELKRYCKKNCLPDKMILGWNQMQEISKYSETVDISDYVKCFDEIHNIIATLSYRHSIIYDIVRWKELQTKCITVTATSCGESEVFCKNAYKFRFSKDPKYKLKTYKYTPKLPEDEEGKMNITPEIISAIGEFGYKGNYDKIVVFDNVKHPEIYHAWRTEALHYCKDRRKEKDVESLQKTNDLKQKVFVTTTYGTEGIEIKTPVDKVLFIIPLRSSVTYTVVIQLLNRFRIMKNADIVFIGTGMNNHPVFDEDGPVLEIVNQIKQNNPDFLEWKEKENYYLSAWMYWKNTDLDNEKLDLFPKLVMLYHNYMLNQTLTEYNLHTFFPDIKYKDFIALPKTDDDIKDHLMLLGKYPLLAFSKLDSKNAMLLLKNFCNLNDLPADKSELDLDKYLNDEESYPIINTELFTDWVKDPSLPGKLIRTMQMIQNIFKRLKPDFDLNELFYNDLNAETTNNIEKIIDDDLFKINGNPFNNEYDLNLFFGDFYKKEQISKHINLWTELTGLQEFKFIIKMMQLFTTIEDHRFKSSAFKRFFDTREKMKSKPITQKQSDRLEEDINAYKSFLNRFNLTDDLTKNVFESLWDQIKDIDLTKKSKRDRKTVKFVLIEDRNIFFGKHEECYEYAVKNGLTKASLSSWVKNGIWKKFFEKTKN